MPIFEYQCHECGAQFEKIVLGEANSVKCSKCHSPRVLKLLSVFAVSGGSSKNLPLESGPCGTCGAPRRGMCGE